MKQLVQSVKNGELRHVDHPQIEVGPTRLRVAVHASLISSGTERSTHELAGSSLLQKAKARPDLVRAVIERARQDGVRSTVETVRSRLDEDMPVGYSAAGMVTFVGEAAAGFRPGDRVATAGAGHAEVQSVPMNLAARLPDNVTFEEAAFGAIASVSLHGLRLAEVGPGSRIVIVGLGLIGQLAVRLGLAAGCHVAGIDIDPQKALPAQESGASTFPASADGLSAIADWTAGRGADAVLVTAATKSSEPMQAAATVARDRATIVSVGDVGLDLDRRTLYTKELTIKVSRSYGPGRYDPNYESLGIDYPIGYVRWPIGRNLEAVISLIGSGRLTVLDLVTHRFPFDDAIAAYDTFESDDPYLGILLGYKPEPDATTSIQLNRSARPRAAAGGLASGLVGAGRFASGVLLPAAQAAGFGPWTRITSAGGASAVRVGELNGFDQAVTNAAEVVGDETTEIVFIASRHDSHASIVQQALAAGKHVFCEKPLALSTEELDATVTALNQTAGVLMVGFNRRWSPAVRDAVEYVGSGSPLLISYRVHAGALPDDHWLNDRRQGGRLLGEGCHFIDTCNAITGETPRTVYAIGSGRGETSLQDDFTITLAYPSGSQAAIIYSAGSPRGAGKEYVEVMRGDRRAVIDDYRLLTLSDATTTAVTRYKPADKGHEAEFVVLREAIEGRRDGLELSHAAVATSRVALAAVESLMTGSPIEMDQS